MTNYTTLPDNKQHIDFDPRNHFATAVTLADWLEEHGIIKYVADPKDYYRATVMICPRNDGVGDVVWMCYDTVSHDHPRVYDDYASTLRTLMMCIVDAETAARLKDAPGLYIGKLVAARLVDRLMTARGA